MNSAACRVDIRVVAVSSSRTRISSCCCCRRCPMTKTRQPESQLNCHCHCFLAMIFLGSVCSLDWRLLLLLLLLRKQKILFKKFISLSTSSRYLRWEDERVTRPTLICCFQWIDSEEMLFDREATTMAIWMATTIWTKRKMTCSCHW